MNPNIRFPRSAAPRGPVLTQIIEILAKHVPGYGIDENRQNGTSLKIMYVKLGVKFIFNPLFH